LNVNALATVQMNDELLTMMLEGATLLRLGVFTGVLLMMAVLEQAFPRRRRRLPGPCAG